jgi:glutathionylspermidine amidase/synthetase
MPKNIVLSFILVCFFSVATAQAEEQGLPQQCSTDCVTTYGSVLGVSPPDIKAYSNCQPGCVIFQPNTYNGVYTGIKWQCVEFARRWLLEQKGAVYGDVDIAADIWTKIDYLTEVATGKKIPLASYVNGSTQAPGVGDLLIYASEFLGTGHVAVITGIDNKAATIEVGEQNYNNTPWSSDHARSIPFIKKGDQYWLLDGYLLGWKQIQKTTAPGALQ